MEEPLSKRPPLEHCKAWLKGWGRLLLLPEVLRSFDRGVIWGEWEDEDLGYMPAVVSADGDRLLVFWWQREVGLFPIVVDDYRRYFYSQTL